jgi:hypothetical protein
MRGREGRLCGTTSIYAITSTVSGNGDQGADPNELVVITDRLDAVESTPPTGEASQSCGRRATWTFYAASLSRPEPASSNSIEMNEGGRVACYETPAVFLLAR